MRAPTASASPKAHTGRAATVLFWTIILIAAGLRVYGLGSQLWLDEIAAVSNSIRRPAIEIATQWPGPASHVLVELLAHWSIAIFGETPFFVRLPAALFGIAGVAAVYALARQIFARGPALLAAGLLAVSYHHVFFSQDARGYTALILFFAVSSRLFLRFATGNDIPTLSGLGYTASTTLAAYAHPFGVFIPAAHFLIALFVSAGARTRAEAGSFPLIRYLLFLSAAGLLIVILYAPLLEPMLSLARMNATTEAEGPRLGFGFLLEVFEGLRAAFFGPVGVAAAGLVGLAGLVAWWRRDRLSVWVLVLPIALQAAAFGALGFGIHPRYFAIALPLVFIVGAYVVFRAVEWALRAAATPDATRRLATGALLCGLVLISAYPLLRYYQIPKQDFRGALEIIAREAAPDAVKIGIQSAGSVMNQYYAADYLRVDTLEELTAQEGGRPVWLVTSLERILKISQPDLYEHIKRNYDLVHGLPGTVGNGTVWIYKRRSAGGG
jgi:uncharacterized membrane protein